MDPYEVLEIKRGASQEEIKRAYREQVKKYHPDKYRNNPLADLAEEKLREINAAYEMLTEGGNGGYEARAGGYPGGGGYGFAGEEDGTNFHGGAPKQGTAEWYYQQGVSSINRGWYEDGLGKIQTAVSMEPGNLTYRSALNQALAMGNGYRQNAYGRGYTSNDDLCRMCQCLICTDCLCDCI